MTAPPPGIKNWHWRTKGVEAWSKEWFQTKLTGIEANGVTISGVTDVEGDAELGMRKSKLVTIYDQKITMAWKAEDSNGEEVKGTLVAVEVAHDMDEDEYVFTATLDTPHTIAADAFCLTAKRALANKLRPIFQQYPTAIIDTHGKDLLSEEGDSTPPSGATTPAPAAAAPSLANLSIANATASKPVPTEKFNTAVVKCEGEFQCTAADLFDFLTKEEKIRLWAQKTDTMNAEVGAPMSFLNGNINGKVVEVDRPASLSTTWRAPTWPEGYYGTLQLLFVQGASSTTLTLRLSGVPVGKEDEAERNLDTYYIRSLKSIGSVLHSSSFPSFPSSTPSSPPSPSLSRSTGHKPSIPRPSRWSLVLTSAVPISISVGLIGALLTAFWYGPSGPGGKQS